MAGMNAGIGVSYSDIVVLVIYAMAVATASTTIAASRLFKDFRAWAHTKSLLFGALVSCPFCAAHWLAAFGLVFCAPRPVRTWFMPADYAIAWLASVALAAMFVRLIGHTNKTDQEEIIEHLTARIEELDAEARNRAAIGEARVGTNGKRHDFRHGRRSPKSRRETVGTSSIRKPGSPAQSRMWWVSGR